ncbi:pyruvate ferredoxin oxidoreductase [Patescibacteria group bacterium]|nr:pyruvate ferredoxin oxidoreductase [Patescibacteria group bacterium]
MPKDKLQKIMTGGEAVAEAMRQVNPDVVSAYPITPQTPIIETFSQIVADGKVDTEYILAESEHSALSCVTAASAAGARAMTATASQGLAYMWEMLGATAGMRLPVVMAIANRALSSPLNIHCDHSDSMGARDQGWIQIFSENNQEVYENTLLALRLSEDHDVLLPTMVMQDGFSTSHSAENMRILDDAIAKNFVGEFKPHKPLLNFSQPMTYGPVALPDTYFEVKRQQIEAMRTAKKKYLEIGAELSKITGNQYPYFEEYKLKDAEVAIVTSSSTAGTIKEIIDGRRAKGEKVGLLKIKLYRPFPYEEITKALSHIKTIGVMDRSPDYGSVAPFYGDIKVSFADSKKPPQIQSYVFGLGGREIMLTQIEKVFTELLNGEVSKETKYVGLKE